MIGSGLLAFHEIQMCILGSSQNTGPIEETKEHKLVTAPTPGLIIS